MLTMVLPLGRVHRISEACDILASRSLGAVGYSVSVTFSYIFIQFASEQASALTTLPDQNYHSLTFTLYVTILAC
jgi:hypothetical protein